MRVLGLGVFGWWMAGEAASSIKAAKGSGPKRLFFYLSTDLSWMDAPGASAATLAAEITPSEEQLQRCFLK